MTYLKHTPWVVSLVMLSATVWIHVSNDVTSNKATSNGVTSDADARQDTAQEEDPTGIAYSMDDLEKERAESGRSYLSFLNRSTLTCGVYFLAAGSRDGQSPHGQDEVYYVRSGKAKLTVDGEEFDAVPGEVLFVAANAEHRFHDIEEDLTLLVFFSTAPIE